MTLAQKFATYFSIVILVIAVGSVISYLIGLSGGFNVPRLNLLNSVYYTVDTLTTNSYGDIVPISAVAKVFTVATELAGVSIFIGALTILTGEIMESRLNRLTGGISDAEARLLRNHVVLIGTNSVNMYLAGQLKSMKKRFVLLTSKKDHLDALKDTGLPIHLVNVTSKLSLRRYGIEFADRVVIDMKEKDPSMYNFLVVRSLAGKDTKIIVIARDEEMEQYFSDIAKGRNEKVINPEYSVAKGITEKL